MKKTYSALLFCLAMPNLLYPGDVTGVFTFPERKPFVALVYFADDPGSGPEMCGSLDQKNKAFSKRIVTAKTGCEVTFLNSDEMQHNIFALSSVSDAAFDVGLLPPGKTSSAIVEWAEGEVVRLGCKIHPKMRSYIANVPSRYFAVVSFEDADGPFSFTISDVPDELDQVKVWFPKMDPIELTLEMNRDQSIDVTRRDQSYGTLEIKR